ncbi:MAG: hypothetical protein AAF806_10450 [Bacteroidota bacterium]
MNIAQKIINEKTTKLELIQGKSTDGKSFWAFVLIPTDVLEKLKAKFGTQKVELEKYGLVLKKGVGVKPSIEVEQEVFQKLARMKKIEQ